MIELIGVKWHKTKGHNRFITALRMMLGLSYKMPISDKLAEGIVTSFTSGESLKLDNGAWIKKEQ